MADISSIHDLLSGKSKGLFPSIMRSGLRLLEPIYATGVRWKNQKHDRKPGLAQKVAAKVISVGNLTTGGTGKTPVIAMLAQWLTNDGVNVGIVSRGYKSSKGELNDEGKELKLIRPTVPHIQHRDRVLAANKLIEKHKVDVILVDDGFQHRRLFRDVDIVLIDATNPFGFGHLLPRGLLREPVESLQRADVALITRTDLVGKQDLDQIIDTISKANPSLYAVRSIQKPTGLVNINGERNPVSTLANKRAIAFCGIGNPSAFKRTLSEVGCNVERLKEFPDHHSYSKIDVEDILNSARTYNAEIVVCTLKDMVKLKELSHIPNNCVALEIAAEIIQGIATLEKLVCCDFPLPDNKPTTTKRII